MDKKIDNEMEAGIVGVYEVPIRFIYWLAVKELNLSCYIGETLLCTIYTHYGDLLKFLSSKPAVGGSSLKALSLRS